MSALFMLPPDSAQMPSANFPWLISIHATERRRILEFHADLEIEEACAWAEKVYRPITGPLTAIVTYSMTSSNTGTVQFAMAVEADTVPTDGLNVHSSTSYAAENVGTAQNVPGTAGVRASFSITLTTDDSIAEGDEVRFKLVNKPAGTAAGSICVHRVEIRDAA